MARPNLSSCPKQKWTADAKLAKNPSHFSDLTALAVGVSIIISGREAVSEINPLAIINGKIISSSNFNARTIANTIGVKIRAAPSFAKKADTAAPSKMT